MAPSMAWRTADCHARRLPVVYDRTMHRSLVVVSIVLAPVSAFAANPNARPLFEPTDMELQDPGTIQVDTQVGPVRGQGPWRVVVPDFEIDVGLMRNVEFDIDGTYAIEGPDAGGFSLDHPAPDNLWLSAKLGLYDARDLSNHSAWAFGMQIGPKIPAAQDAHGAGYEGLLLVARTIGDAHIVLNLGGLADPGPSASRGRPVGVEGGLDLNVSLPGSAHLSILSELGGVHFFSDYLDQLHLTAGLSWAATSTLDLSVIGLKGFVSGGDRYGALVGITKRLPVAN